VAAILRTEPLRHFLGGAVKKPRRKRLITRLYDAIDQINELMKDADKKPSVLKAAVSRAEILHDLLRRDDAEKARKAEEKAASAPAPVIAAPAAPLSAESLIAQVEELKQQRQRGAE
jgi:hypothetical protein